MGSFSKTRLPDVPENGTAASRRTTGTGSDLTGTVPRHFDCGSRPRSDTRKSGNVLFEGRSRLRQEDVRALSETNLQLLTARTTIPFVAPMHSSL